MSRANFNAELIAFTVENIDQCSRNWLASVVEWIALEIKP